MLLTKTILDDITNSTKYASRKVALSNFLNANGGDMMRPHRLAMFLAQILHESGNLRYVKEVWGPTKAQQGYEGRADLGNTQPGDGKRYMGRDVIQITGRFNYRHLTKWAHENGTNCPDFEAKPGALEKPEWLGLGALWYWTTRVPLKYVDSGNHEMVTRRINGGLNGYSDRLKKFDRAALVILGFGIDGVKEFQQSVGLYADGISGPKTRDALFAALVTMPDTKPKEKPKSPSFIERLIQWLENILNRQA